MLCSLTRNAVSGKLTQKRQRRRRRGATSTIHRFIFIYAHGLQWYFRLNIESATSRTTNVARAPTPLVYLSAAGAVGLNLAAAAARARVRTQKPIRHVVSALWASSHGRGMLAFTCAHNRSGLMVLRNGIG